MANGSLQALSPSQTPRYIEGQWWGIGEGWRREINVFAACTLFPFPFFSFYAGGSAATGNSVGQRIVPEDTQEKENKKNAKIENGTPISYLTARSYRRRAVLRVSNPVHAKLCERDTHG